jgi:hypothetical protein
MFLAHAANNWGLYNNLSWTPTFYAEQYGLNVQESAFCWLFPPSLELVADYPLVPSPTRRFAVSKIPPTKG